MGSVREDRVTDMAMRIVAAWYKVRAHFTRMIRMSTHIR